MGWGVAFAIWAAGVPVFHALDRDRTGTRADRLRDASAWPLLMLVPAVIGTAWAIGKLYVAASRLRRMLAC